MVAVGTTVVPPQRPAPGALGGQLAHRSPAEREAAGLAARKAVPPGEHAEVALPSDRPDPVAVLEAQAASRLAELVPIRYGRMLVSPFTFYRGAAALMAGDLAAGPSTRLAVQLCGDAHLSNFGVFASPERRLLFDVNDFDETLPGPWEWDVKRLAASLVVAGRDNEFRRKERRAVVLAAVRRYRDAMAAFAGMRQLDVWYAHLDVEALLGVLRDRLTKARRTGVEQNLAKARANDSLKAFKKLTTVVDGQVRIKADPPLVVPIGDLLAGVAREELEAGLRDLLVHYRDTLQPDRRTLYDAFEWVDLARKVVGVGSVGTRCWIGLLRGRDDGDPLFLQLKEAQPSVLAAHLPDTAHPVDNGERVVTGQRLMQAASDVFLGWQRSAGLDGVERDFYVRQLRDQKGSAVIERMDPTGMSMYAEMCGWTLARAHARSGDRIAISAYLGDDDSFPAAMVTFAERYADRNERDHAALAEAVGAGRVAAETGL